MKKKKWNGGSCKEIFKNRKIFLTKPVREVWVVLFLYAFVFSDCNSAEDVPKTIYTAKIEGYR